MQDIDAFKNHLIRKGLRLSTVNLRIECIRILFKISPKLDIETINRYLTEQRVKGRKASYLNQLIFAIRAWGKWREIESYALVELFKEEQAHRPLLSDEEIEQICNFPLPPLARKDTHYKISMFYKIKSLTGMRGSEVAGLTVNDVDFGRNVFDLMRTKTDPRIVPISPLLKDELGAYIKKLKTEKLFPGINPGVWRFHFQKRCEALGIKRHNLTPHAMRRSFIVRLVEEDVNLLKIQRIVGHKRVSTTERYTTLTSKDLANAMNKDRLGRKTHPYAERFNQVRKGLRKLLEEYTTCLDEEKQMLKDLGIDF